MSKAEEYLAKNASMPIGSKLNKIMAKHLHEYANEVSRERAFNCIRDYAWHSLNKQFSTNYTPHEEAKSPEEWFNEWWINQEESHE